MREDFLSLQKPANAEVDYKAMVRLYVEKMAHDGKPGEAVLGADIPGLGDKDSRITVTADFLLRDDVAKIIKGVQLALGEVRGHYGAAPQGILERL